MPNSKKSRNHKTSPNTAGQMREAIQHAAHCNNNTRRRNNTPTAWQRSKAKRLALRKAAGKTFANWSKKNEKYKTSGPNSLDTTGAITH